MYKSVYKQIVLGFVGYSVVSAQTGPAAALVPYCVVCINLRFSARCEGTRSLPTFFNDEESWSFLYILANNITATL